MKNVLFIHPLKHHAYGSINGILKTNNNLTAFLGMYKNNKIIDFILKLIKKENYIKSYYNESISNCVYTNFYTQIMFLCYKKNIISESEYLKKFENKSNELIDRHNYDVVHVLQDYCNSSIRYAKSKNKVIVYEHIIAFDTTIEKYINDEVNKWGFSNEYINRNYNKEKISKAKENIMIVDYILCPSKFVTKTLESEFGKEILDKIIEIPYGADTEKFNYRERSYCNDKLEILCVSRVTLTKGTKYLIEAMKKLRNEKINLTYIGMPSDEEDYKLVDELKHLENVNYIPNVPHSEIKKYFSRADIFVLPSLIEGSALSIYEALASGLPCIVTSNSGSVITNGKEGFIVEPQSTEQLAEKIDFCNKNRECLKSMSLLARETSLKYTWDNYSNNIRKVYDNIITKS